VWKHVPTGWQLSWVSIILGVAVVRVVVVLGVNYPRWQLSGWQLSWVAIVLGGSCPMWQLSK